MTRKWLRWMPAVVVPAVIAAGVLAGSLPASAGDPLPEKTPQQVLPWSPSTARKPCPGRWNRPPRSACRNFRRPGPVRAPPETAWLELLTGPHTARVYLDGPDKARVQVMDRMAERNAVRNGDDVWFYNSKDNTAAHAASFPPMQPAATASTARARNRAADARGPGRAAARQTRREHRRGRRRRMSRSPAGRPTTWCSPRRRMPPWWSPVAIAVDGETGLPLGVEVKARGQAEPAFSVAFTSLTLEAPDASLFNFTPPPGRHREGNRRCRTQQGPPPAHAAVGR